jgi:hypothetical protein
MWTGMALHLLRPGSVNRVTGTVVAFNADLSAAAVWDFEHIEIVALDGGTSRTLKTSVTKSYGDPATASWPAPSVDVTGSSQYGAPMTFGAYCFVTGTGVTEPVTWAAFADIAQTINHED